MLLGWELHSLFIDWNPAVKVPASLAAKDTSYHFCASHETMPWAPDWRVELPALDTKALPYTAVATCILGAMYAASLDVTYVLTGIRAEVASSPQWSNKLRELMSYNEVTPPRIFSHPAYDWDNAFVSEEAERLEIDLTSTWSCSRSYPACGECNSCKRRKEMGI